MDNPNYTIEHRKGQHLLAAERHEIEARLRDGWSPYRIAKQLGHPYNTIEYDILCEQYDRSRLDEIIALMVDVRCGRTDYYTISEVEYPAELGRERFAEITCSHIKYIMDIFATTFRREQLKARDSPEQRASVLEQMQHLSAAERPPTPRKSQVPERY